MPSNSEELPRGYRVSEVARKYRVGRGQVLSWIKSGQLRALNLAKSQSALPRYLITPEALAEFESRKQVPTPPPPKRRKKVTRGKDFYPD